MVEWIIDIAQSNNQTIDEVLIVHVTVGSEYVTSRMVFDCKNFTDKFAEELTHNLKVAVSEYGESGKSETFL